MTRLLLLFALLGGCTAEVWGLGEPDPPEVCGGAVCFTPAHVEVRRWGAGTVEVVAVRSDRPGCAMPSTGAEPTDGTAVLLRLESPRLGARLPIVPRDRFDLAEGPRASAHAVRVHGGRALADEESVSGEATVLELDPKTGRVLVRVRARWSSGVSGELLLAVDGPTPCAF
jgi:hypothetical protein